MSEEKQVVNESVENVTTQAESQVSPDAEIIAESKKYRKRAQEAEAREAKLMKQIEASENTKLKEKEEFKELAEKFESQVNELTPYKDMYESLVDKRKESLLNRLPENQRDKFKDKDLDVLEFVVEQTAANTPVEPSARGSVKTPKYDKDWTKMDKGDIKKNWTDILRDATSRNN